MSNHTTDHIIDVLEAAGGNRWTKGDHDRVYFDLEAWGPLVGCQPRRSGSGHLSHGEINGERISNNDLNKLAWTKIWYDLADGKIYTQTPDRSKIGGLLDEIVAKIRDIVANAEAHERTAEANHTTTPRARIIDTGSRKVIPTLEVTLPDGTVRRSKGNRATSAPFVAIRHHIDEPDKPFFTTHARRDLAVNYVVNGKAADAPRWVLVEILDVEPLAEEEPVEEPRYTENDPQPSGDVDIEVTVHEVSVLNDPIIAFGAVSYGRNRHRFSATVWPGDTQYVEIFNRRGGVEYKSGFSDRYRVDKSVIDAIAAEVERAWSNR